MCNFSPLFLQRGNALQHAPQHESRKADGASCPPLDDDSSDCNTLRDSKGGGSSSSEATTDAFTEAWLLATEYQRQAGVQIGAEPPVPEQTEPDGSSAAGCACSKVCGGGLCLACQVSWMPVWWRRRKHTDSRAVQKRRLVR